MTTAQTEAVESKGAVILLQEELQAAQEDAQRQRTQYERVLAQLDRERGMAQAEFQQCNSLLVANGKHLREKKSCAAWKWTSALCGASVAARRKSAKASSPRPSSWWHRPRAR